MEKAQEELRVKKHTVDSAINAIARDVTERVKAEDEVRSLA
ncbi:MAG: hypothetical protein QW390_01215 [Candidatus Bathyarchaeia archaeon]